MSRFIIIPKYQSKENPNVSYNAPSMFIEAQDQGHAIEIAESSALSRFDEWSFHVATFFEKPKHSGVAPSRNADPKSKSQKGKLVTGHSDSRPLRRGLKRLGIARVKTKSGTGNPSHHKGGTMKMWS